MESDGDDFALATDDRAKVEVSTGELHAGTGHLCTQCDGVRWPTHQLHVYNQGRERIDHEDTIPMMVVRIYSGTSILQTQQGLSKVI